MHHLTKNLTALAMFAALLFFPAALVLAGDLEPPTGPASSMKTLQQIWDKLESIENTCCSGGGDASIPKTGQTTSYGTHDDGALQHGEAWPEPRFTDNDDGTVTDNLTNLVWLKDANCFGQKNWNDALAAANGLARGQCGLTDGSVAGDWWLPNVRQLQSLIDYGRFDPALPSGHPFTGVQHYYYWSNTTHAGYADRAWYMFMPSGHMYYNCYKTRVLQVWPVRERK